MKQFHHLYDNYLIKPANSIMHNPFRLFLLENNLFEPVLTNKVPIDVQDEFLDLYPKWIQSSNLNSFKGLDSFPYRYVSLGVTQSIDDFVIYCLKNNKRIRFLKGEYGYAREISSYEIQPLIDDHELVSGDAVVISCPFSATGDIHPRWDEIINTCNKKEIPVLVDCAFFGTCLDIFVDFDQPCIDTVAFSPTKGLNCGNLRTGMALSKRKGKDCSLDILTEWHHGIHFHTYLAFNLMKNFGPDTIPTEYRDIQIKVCNHYGLTPTKTMHLGLGGTGWEHFNREGVSNRIGLRNAIYDYANNGMVK